MATQDDMDELKMNPDALYREEVFTDQETGSIRRLTPVDRRGEAVAGAQARYQGQTQVLTPAGPLPLSFEIEADSLGEAAERFAAGAMAAIEEAVAEIKRMQREAQSSIVMPGQGAPVGGRGFGGGGGLKL